MSIRHLIWGAALAVALPVTLVAQQAPPHFYTVACVKVKPEKAATFKTLVSDLHKYEQSRVDSGAASAVIETRAISPAGASAECDYEFITFYSGVPTAPMGEDAMSAALQKAGVSAELHLFAKGGHAFGLRPTNSPITHWPQMAEAWLVTIGVLPK